MKGFIIGLLTVLTVFAVRAEISVIDDDGRQVKLSAPARRIVSLAPHTTELAFAAGAGSLVVGTVKFADYPEAAKKIPRVGDNALLDMETIVNLQPDLILVWLHGNSEKHLEKVRKLGIPMFYSRPEKLRDIPAALDRIGRLAGTEPAARKAGEKFTKRLGEMEARYSHRPPVRLFFQVWQKPLLTINGTQIISDVIRLCGGSNVFSEELMLVPTVDAEAVVQARPEAVLKTANANDAQQAGLEIWRKLPNFLPTATGNLVLLKTDALGRPTPRILEGAAVMCEELERVRERRRP